MSSAVVEAVETKALLSAQGMSVGDANAAVQKAESNLQDAQAKLQKTKKDVQSDIDEKRQTARQETKESKQAKRPTTLNSELQNQLDKASEKRADQKEARNNVKAPAIFTFRHWSGKGETPRSPQIN